MEWDSVMPLGKVNKVSDTDLLGSVAKFADRDYGSAETVKPLLSGDIVYARLMINDSGGTLAAGAVVRGDVGTTYGPRKGVDGTALIASNHVAVGFVDPYLTAAVPDAAFFWVIYKGPAKALFTTGTTLTAGDGLQNGASGRVTQMDFSTPAAAENLHRVGTVLAAVDTAIASDTLFRIAAHCWAGGA